MSFTIRDYSNEMVQAIIVGGIIAFIVLVLIQLSGTVFHNVPSNVVIIIIFFIIGIISVWWALFKLNANTFFGVREGRGF